MTDLRARCLNGIDTSVGRGLEIGPLNRPLLPRCPGRIFSADHFSTERLRQKYAGDPAVAEQDIRDVDFDLSAMALLYIRSKTGALARSGTGKKST